MAFVFGPDDLLASPRAPVVEVTAPARADLGPREATELATDDWPHLYLSERAVPRLYAGVLGAVLLLATGLVLALARPAGLASAAHFMLLGTGFMLLETRSITKVALLFGSTWIVNAIVIAFILLCVLAGNALVMRGWSPQPKVAWVLLFASLLAGYLVPIDIVLDLPLAPRVMLAGFWIALPVLFASFLFSHSFARARAPAPAFGANLLGVVMGGVLEYESMVLGLNALYLVAIGAYLLALLAALAWARSPSG